MSTLNKLQLGQSAKIINIDNDLEIKNRLLDIGFTKGSKIECFLKSSFNGPTAYKIKNTTIALRECDCKKIRIERCA